MLHHEFRKGQKVFIILKNGQQIIDKFVATKGNYLICENSRYAWKAIRSSTIYKHQNRE